MSAKLTPWFPADVKPVYVGWYHTKANYEQVDESPWNWYWDGKVWKAFEDENESFIQNRIWRGIIK